MDVIYEISPLAFGVETELARTGIARVCAETLRALDSSLEENDSHCLQFYTYSSASRWHNILAYILVTMELGLRTIKPLVDPCDLSLISYISSHQAFSLRSFEGLLDDYIPESLLTIPACLDYLRDRRYLFINSYLPTPAVVRLNPDAHVIHQVHDLFPVTRPTLFHQGMDVIWRDKIADFSESDDYACVSQFTADDLLQCFPFIDASRVRIISNSGDHARRYAETNKTELCQQYDLLPSNYFITVSTLEPRKNLPDLLIAFQEFKRLHPCDQKLVIIGSRGWLGSAESNFLSIFTDRPDIIMLGRLEDDVMFSLVGLASAYISTARCEGFGLGLAEAMALGCLTIAPNNTAQKEVIGSAGFLYDDIAQLIQCMSDSLSNSTELEHRRTAARNRFSWQLSSHRWLHFLRDIERGITLSPSDQIIHD